MKKIISNTAATVRQGDVFLAPVSALPPGCTEVPHEDGRIVLMHGEVTGHHHVIADWDKAGDMARAAFGLANRRARLLVDGAGNRFLEVKEKVSLRHINPDGSWTKDHTAHEIPPGIYELPQQMEHTADRAPRRVED